MLVQGLNGAAQISLGISSTCAVNAAKELRCWGDNSAGQLGTGDNIALFAPASGPTLTEIDRVEAGTWNTVCVLGEDLRVWCFGAPMASFQLGGNPTEVQQVMGPHLAVGTGFACAGSVDGLKCLGDDGAGQLGDGEPKQHSSVPVSVLASALWGGVGAGDAASYAFTTNGKVYAWGGNSHGQLGMTGPDRSSPTEVPIPPSVVDIDSVDGGFRHACVAGSDNQTQRVVYCFGSNEKGELGQGSIGGTSAVPKQVLAGPGTALRASRVAVGWQHNCAVVSEGTEIVCWGLNVKGQLGDGSYAIPNYPVRVVFP
jgi:alpha-tubulin suppressor-like RCC1 family protein